MILSTNMHAAMQAHFDVAFGFIGYEIEVTPPAAAAKAHLRATGWTYRTAAARLGVSYQHISYVLNGQRSSHSLLARIHKLTRRQP